MEILIRAAQLIFSLTILVFFHELGHFFFSKVFKVRVEKFYLFFNPGFSLLRAKKIEGKWKFQFFKNNTPGLSQIATDHLGNKLVDKNGNYLYNTIDIDKLPENDWRKHPENTEWGIGWLPLGGYCKIAGMVDESMDKGQMAAPAKEWEYRAVSPWKRLPIITGGVLVNFILALLIYSAVAFHWGDQYIPMKNYTSGFEFSNAAKAVGFKDGDLLLKADNQELEQFDERNIRQILSAKQIEVRRSGKTKTIDLPKDFSKTILFESDYFALPILPFVVSEVIDESPAKKYGIQKEDSLVYINNLKQSSFFNFAKNIQSHKQNGVEIGLYRYGSLKIINIIPDSTGKIGVRPYSYAHFFKINKVEYSFFESIPVGIENGLNKLTGYVSDFKYLFSKEGVENLGGFASMGKMYDVEWNWLRLWEMTAFLSIILAFMNILPIPGLDGGHLLFLLYELIVRKKPSQKFLEKSQIIGMIFLLGLMVFANVNDLFK